MYYYAIKEMSLLIIIQLITDSLGLHRVENPSSSDVAVSLHLYCPPFGECSIFNQLTGKRTVCKVTFWSKYGKRPDRVSILLLFI